MAPLRVGILLDHHVQPRWIATIIEDIRASGCAEVVLVVLNATKPRPRPGFWTKLRRWSRSGLYAVYTSLDEKKFRTDPDPFEAVDLTALLEDVAAIAVEPRATRFSDYFDDESVDRILTHDLDVALRFGFRILKSRALAIARFGVWSYHHGDNLRYRGGPAGFWEVVEDEPVTGSVLQVLNDELDNGSVICRSHSPTHRLSVWRNRQNYYWGSAGFVVRKLAALHRCGPAALVDPLGSSITPYSRRLYRTPSNAEMIRFLGRLGARYLEYEWRVHTCDTQWFIAYKVRRRPAHPDAPPDATIYNFKHLLPPPDRFWADPFPLRVDGRDFIFFEEFIYATGRGRIACVQVDAAGAVDSPRVALEEDWHLSYPNVFTWNGEVYMVPESFERRRVELYRCVSFPDRWESIAVLVDDVPAVDPSVIRWNGRWWMFFATAQERTTTWNELHIFHADDLLGPWMPHADNPVKSDVRSARPAGRPFIHAGRLFRPAQDGSRRYGHSIVIHEVRRLDPDHFEEVETSRIGPEWAPRLVGTHTINGNEGLTAIDGLRIVRRTLRRQAKPETP